MREQRAWQVGVMDRLPALRCLPRLPPASREQVEQIHGRIDGRGLGEDLEAGVTGVPRAQQEVAIVPAEIVALDMFLVGIPPDRGDVEPASVVELCPQDEVFHG